MKYLSANLLLIICCKTIAQPAVNENNILTCTQKRIGVYLTFAEFRSNSPSVRDTALLGDRTNKKYKLEDSTGTNKPVWGYCTGDKVYYLVPNLGGRHYVELQTVDRYCIFIDSYTNYHPMITKDGNMSPSVPTGARRNSTGMRILVQYVLNINNGNHYELTRGTLETILEQDSELLKQFKTDNKRKRKYEFYIREFCKRNPDQVKPFTG